MRCDRLLARGSAVPEETAFLRPHLKQPEVLAVLRGRPKSRLAPRDRHRLLAMRAEDVTDRKAWRPGHPLPCLALAKEAVDRSDRLRHLPQTILRPLQRGPGVGLMFRRAQEPAVLLEEANGAAVPPRSVELLREPGVKRARHALLLRVATRLGRVPPVRCRSGLCHENEREQANE